MERVSVGDLVLSLAGRDKGEYFVVIAVNGNRVSLVNGKARKVKAPKSKNIKHLKVIGISVLKELADKINGLPVSDKRVRRCINSVKP